MNICQVSECGNAAGAKETCLLDALSWKTKQERELWPHARGPAPHPAQLLPAGQAGVSLHFLHPWQRLGALPTCREDSLLPYSWSSDRHALLVFKVSWPHLWVSASSGNTTTDC